MDRGGDGFTFDARIRTPSRTPDKDGWVANAVSVLFEEVQIVHLVRWRLHDIVILKMRGNYILNRCHSE